MTGIRLFETAGLVLLPATSAAAQTEATSPGADVPHESILALRVDRPPTIDGHLTDECWTLAEPASHLGQLDADEGRPSTESTTVRVAFDDEALYVGVRML